MEAVSSIESLEEQHFRLVDAVNEAKTEQEHWLAEQRLNGWRMAVEKIRGYVDLMGADWHTMGRYGEHRPMCCGVLLDWRDNLEKSA